MAPFNAFVPADGVVLAGADYRGAGINDLCADRDVIVAELRTWT